MKCSVMSGKQAPWMGIVLKLAGIYNLAFGAWVVLAPEQAFRLFEMAPPTYPFLWQCIGMIVGVRALPTDSTSAFALWNPAQLSLPTTVMAAMAARWSVCCCASLRA